MRLVISGRPLVSIVTPSLNQGEFLPRCLWSVSAQDYPLVEHRVVDGGSTDQTLSILARASYPHPKSLRFSSAPDGGQAAAVNTGLRDVRGLILGWLNSDDMYLPGALSRVAAHFAANPDHVMVYGEAIWIDAADRPIGRYPVQPPEAFSAFRDGCFLCQPAVFFRAALVETIGFLDQALVTSMDYDYWIRAFRAFPGRIGYIPHALAASRIHVGCKTVAMRRRVHLEGMEVVGRHFGVTPTHWFFSYVEESLRQSDDQADVPCTAVERRRFLKAALPYYDKEQRRAIKARLLGDRRLALRSRHILPRITVDGWTGEHGGVDVFPPAGALTLELTVRHDRPFDWPVVVAVSRDGVPVLRQVFPKNGEYLLVIPLGEPPSPGQPQRFDLTCQPTFVPAQADPRLTDTRTLGVEILRLGLR